MWIIEGMKKLTKEGTRCGECGHGKTYDEYAHFCDECGKELKMGQLGKGTGHGQAKIFYKIYKTETPEFCDMFCYSKWLNENIDRIKEKGFSFIMAPTLTPESIQQYLDIAWGANNYPERVE